MGGSCSPWLGVERMKIKGFVDGVWINELLLDVALFTVFRWSPFLVVVLWDGKCRCRFLEPCCLGACRPTSRDLQAVVTSGRSESEVAWSRKVALSHAGRQWQSLGNEASRLHLGEPTRGPCEVGWR